MTSAGGVGLSSITVSPIYKSSQSLSHQSICFAETEHVLSVNGKESSIVLDLEPMRIQLGPCKRTFKAPEPHGFIVKLQKFKSKQMRNPNSHIDSNVGGVSLDVYNETTTCPLNIVSVAFVAFCFFYYPFRCVGSNFHIFFSNLHLHIEILWVVYIPNISNIYLTVSNNNNQFLIRLFPLSNM